MIDQLTDLFFLLLAAMVGALALGVPAIRHAHRLGLVDWPGSAPHKKHDSPTPLVGGLVLAFGLFIAYVLVRPPSDHQTQGILLGGLLLTGWGLVDDRVGLHPLAKLAGQFLALGILLAFGVRVQATHMVALDLALTALWVIGLTNAFNFVDSKDGLALGLGGIAAAFFMLATIDSLQPVLAALSAGLLGACLGTFFYNASPARLFLGDSGAQLLGFLLAAIGIAYVPAQAGLPQAVSWFTPILVLGVPIFDMTLVVFSRLRRRRKVYQAGTDHTFHRLVGLGLDPTRAVLAMQWGAILLGLTAFIALEATVMGANLLFAGILAAGVVALWVLERRYVDEAQ